ncbi:K+ channel tetramerization subfamily protein, partial [Acanthamoeba castellanii str. Neff]
REKRLAALELRLQLVEGAEQQAKSAAAGQGQGTRVVRLDVGGRHFTTSLATLTSEADSKLAAMFDHHELELQDTNDGRVFIDRDPVTFALILDWLRTSDPPTGLSADLERRLRRDAAHYGLARLVAAMQKSDVDVGSNERRYEKITIEQLWQLTNEKSNVQLAGVDLRGVCLSGLDLTRARFTRCNLEGADFEWANLNEARLIDCNLNRAMMAGVHLSKANLSSSSCVGTNLKGAVLEGAMRKLVARGPLRETVESCGCVGDPLPHYQAHNHVSPVTEVVYEYRPISAFLIAPTAVRATVTIEELRWTVPYPEGILPYLRELPSEYPLADQLKRAASTGSTEFATLISSTLCPASEQAQEQSIPPFCAQSA